MTDNRSDPGAHAQRLLLTALTQPQRLCGLSPPDWDLLLRVGRRARILGRLEADLADAGRMGDLPPRVVDHLTAARNVIRHRNTLVAWEVDRLCWALSDFDFPLILLKGAAYLLAGLPPARGRLFADIDVLVPEARIQEIERACLARGWVGIRLHPYDERYYRTWMHEIPPLRHSERGTEVDIHHRLLPRTSRLRSDPDPLFASAQPLADRRLAVLAPEDMVLHALVHLFLEGDPNEGFRLRDLLDVHDLLVHFDRSPGFWGGLVPRAQELGFERPLFYGLRFARRLLGTRIPDEVMRASDLDAPWPPLRAFMDRLIPMALLPEHPDHPRPWTGFARQLVYLRSHWLRMPAGILARHLAFKAWLRIRGVRKQADLTRLDLRQQ